jgi:sirohydrochlorin cobaltochelatase
MLPRGGAGTGHEGAPSWPVPWGAVMKRGLLLCAHGARDPLWAQPFEAVATRLRARAPDVVVQLAFLELMAPSLDDGGAALARAGCSQVDVVPLFLGAGGHVRKDLPATVARLGAAFPAVRWRLQDAIGEADAVIDAMAAVALARAGEPGSP